MQSRSRLARTWRNENSVTFMKKTSRFAERRLDKGNQVCESCFQVDQTGVPTDSIFRAPSTTRLVEVRPPTANANTQAPSTLASCVRCPEFTLKPAVWRAFFWLYPDFATNFWNQACSGDKAMNSAGSHFSTIRDCQVEVWGPGAEWRCPVPAAK